MEKSQQNQAWRGFAGLAAGLNPMKSVTFVLALGVTVLAAWKLLKHSGDPRPAFPWYGMIAVSYAGGFLIGRVLGRALKTVAVVIRHSPAPGDTLSALQCHSTPMR